MGTNGDMLITRCNGMLAVRLLVAAAKVVGRLIPLRNESSLFFFFPFLHVGGAERVHADITGCFSQERPWVFFTKKSDNNRFRALFPASARLLNIWPLLKYGYPLSVGIMAGLINRHERPVVFGSNSLFFYLLIPYLGRHVRRVDLLHAFGGGAEEFSLPVAGSMDRRVVINDRTARDLEAQYRSRGLEPQLSGRIALIENRVPVPRNCPEKDGRGPLNVLFVGRGSPEKRVHLVGRIATHCRQAGLAARFSLVGEMGEAVEPGDRENCEFYGETASPDVLPQIYDTAHVLLLTSSREGFPLVVMEAMARGVVPVVTDVGGLSRHLTSGVNGVLVENRDEDHIVREMAEAIARFAADREGLRSHSAAAYEYAKARFGGEDFCAAYRSLLLGAELKQRRGTCPG